MIGMAKDSFFIRKTVNIENTATFQEEAIDMGAYVDALSSSIVRIHNIAASFSDATGTSNIVTTPAAAQFQLTTQSQADTVLPSDRSVVASGRIHVDGNGALPTYVSQDFDMLPQMWNNGYLIGVESLYLGGEASAGFAGNVYVTIVLECTVEKMSQSAAMALALSQQ
jgi:hypothetical protein